MSSVKTYGAIENGKLFTKSQCQVVISYGKENKTYKSISVLMNRNNIISVVFNIEDKFIELVNPILVNEKTIRSETMRENARNQLFEKFYEVPLKERKIYTTIGGMKKCPDYLGNLKNFKEQEGIEKEMHRLIANQYTLVGEGDFQVSTTFKHFTDFIYDIFKILK